MKRFFIVLFIIAALSACSTDTQTAGGQADAFKQEVDAYLAEYNKKYQELLKEASEAEWKLNTKIIEGDTVTARAAEKANEKMAKFTGSKENIDKSKSFLQRKSELSPLQVRQLEVILYAAGSNPETAEEIVKKKIKAQTKQTEDLYGYKFTLKGKPVTTNDIDGILKSSSNLKERQQAWEASKEVGKTLKAGLVNLRDLRNQSVQDLGYKDFFEYQVSEYDMTTPELLNITRGMIRDIWPLYRELHTWARYELAKKYKQPVPEMLPAHWLPNRWGQEWSAMVEVKGLDLDSELKKKSAEWIVREGERFYVSLGFPSLPQSFYEKSSLYPLPPESNYKKNNHASAWHMDNDKDVRSLMSIEPNTEWWGTTLHELGHIYYYMTYTNPDVPVILRGGANRAYHEAMGSLMGLAAMQKPFLTSLNLLPPQTDTTGQHEQEMMAMLKEALDYIVVIPWGAGVMTEFEHQLYVQNLGQEELNKAWWDLKKKYQGIVPPSYRSEEYCDACTKTHINDDPAQYYDYAMSNVLLFQFHDHISRNILKQDPHATNYFGNKEVGDFLKAIMYPGASVNWREHLKKNIGSDMSGKAMVEYFQPLMEFLKEQNKGRQHTLPDTI